MIRTQIQLEDDVYRQLRQFAVDRHRSMAACIREAIGLFLVQEQDAGEDLSDIAGKFRPVPMDGIKDHDRVWTEASIK